LSIITLDENKKATKWFRKTFTTKKFEARKGIKI